MWVANKWFSADMIRLISEEVKTKPRISQRQLSAHVCDWMGWHSPQGKPQTMACRKALREIERRGLISLPAARAVANFDPARKRSRTQSALTPPSAHISCSLAELGPVEVVVVACGNRKSSETWNTLFDSYHYLKSGPLCGSQIRYLVRSPVHGILGGLSFSSATRRLHKRDKWIGWNEHERIKNLRLVVCNSRFLIAPWVEVPNLASHVLGLCASRIARDWQERYGYEPVLLETFVDSSQFMGTSYRAANWRHVGQSAGRSRGFQNGKASTGKKEIFVYPLRKDAQKVLRRIEEEPLALRGPSVDSKNWVAAEFGRSPIFDNRLRSRLYTVVEDFFAQPGTLVPQACGGNVAKSKAAYRLFANKRLDMRTLLRGHVEATVQRAQQQAVVLVPQDTTFLNYTTHSETTGLGPINTKKDGAIGLIVHDTMAFTVEGTPLGVLDVQCWARDPEEAGKSSQRKKLPIADKESYKWLKSYRAVAEAQRLCPQTMFVSIGDRESDLHDLFHEANKTAGGPKLLVRADRGRHRKVGPDQDGQYEDLWNQLTGEPLAGTEVIIVPRQGSRPKRLAKLEVRYAAVTLKPPTRGRLAPMAVWAVYAHEVEAPVEVKEPLEWLLLTTVAVRNYEQALQVLDWYARRWGIEIFHRVLKSGCRLQDRQLSSADRIENCLALDVVVAWRIFWLTKAGRETPEIPCDVILDEYEWKALFLVSNENQPLPDKPPTMREAVRMMARLGGFLGRRCDNEPGTTTTWRGLNRLDGIALGYRMALTQNNSRAGP
jgi:hypothetical protein